METKQIAIDETKRYVADQQSYRTNIELRVRAALRWLGLESREQVDIGNYRVDFALPTYGVYINVNGCYWHRCPACSFDDEDGKRRRDAYRDRVLWERHGWRSVTVWEHDCCDVAETVRTLKQELTPVLELRVLGTKR